MIIQNARGTRYHVPKAHVEQYNGYEIFLDFEGITEVQNKELDIAKNGIVNAKMIL